MDPQAAVHNLLDAMNRNDRVAVNIALQALADWNGAGGFLPQFRKVGGTFAVPVSPMPFLNKVLGEPYPCSEIPLELRERDQRDFEAKMIGTPIDNPDGPDKCVIDHADVTNFQKQALEATKSQAKMDELLKPLEESGTVTRIGDEVMLNVPKDQVPDLIRIRAAIIVKAAQAGMTKTHAEAVKELMESEFVSTPDYSDPKTKEFVDRVYAQLPLLNDPRDIATILTAIVQQFKAKWTVDDTVALMLLTEEVAGDSMEEDMALAAMKVLERKYQDLEFMDRVIKDYLKNDRQLDAEVNSARPGSEGLMEISLKKHSILQEAADKLHMTVEQVESNIKDFIRHTGESNE